MDQAKRVAGIVREVLGDAVIGAYLHGSAASEGPRRMADRQRGRIASATVIVPRR
jgi:predicted nucleotidyltransferase